MGNSHSNTYESVPILNDAYKMVQQQKCVYPDELMGSKNLGPALIWCAANGRLESIDSILKLGCNKDIVNCQYSSVNKWHRFRKMTPLMMACRFCPSAVQKLLDAGADLELKDSNGYTALIYASRHSNDGSSLETVQKLLDAGADPNSKCSIGWSALMYACFNMNTTSSPETVKTLLNAGANPSIRSRARSIALSRCKSHQRNTIEDIFNKVA